MKKKKFDSKKIKKCLPHNFLAEKMVLTCLLKHSDTLELIINSLSVDAFYFKNHQEIYKAILKMYKKKQPIDIVTLVSFLQDNGLITKVGGLNVLLELTNQIASIVYLEEYIKLINEKFIRRSLIKLGYKTINSGYITNIPLENLLIDLEKQIFELTNQIKIEESALSMQIINTVFLELKEKVLTPIFPGLPSGFYDLDLLTQGFQKSDFIVIAGRPSLGKTALSLSITLNILKRIQVPIVIFSLEMSKEQIMYRLLSMESTIPQFKLKTGKLLKKDWSKLNKIIKIFSKLPLFIYDNTNLSVNNIRKKLKTILLEQNQIGLIIIDYLQLIQSSKRNSGDRVKEISDITRSLKNLARELNIPIIALSQLSRNVENRMNQKPILSDLRESGSIEQDADLILMLYQNTIKNLKSSHVRKIDLIIAKQRNGPIGQIQLSFNEQITKFLNLKKK